MAKLSQDPQGGARLRRADSTPTPSRGASAASIFANRQGENARSARLASFESGFDRASPHRLILILIAVLLAPCLALGAKGGSVRVAIVERTGNGDHEGSLIHIANWGSKYISVGVNGDRPVLREQEPHSATGSQMRSAQ